MKSGPTPQPDPTAGTHHPTHHEGNIIMNTINFFDSSDYAIAGPTRVTSASDMTVGMKVAVTYPNGVTDYGTVDSVAETIGATLYVDTHAITRTMTIPGGGASVVVAMPYLPGERVRVATIGGSVKDGTVVGAPSGRGLRFKADGQDSLTELPDQTLSYKEVGYATTISTITLLEDKADREQTLLERAERAERNAETRLQMLRDYERLHEDFKRRVGEVAMELAEEHDWCDVVSNALDELGIPHEEPSYTIELTVTMSGVKGSSRDFTSRVRDGDLRWIARSFGIDSDDDIESIGCTTIEVESVDKD